MYLRILKSKHRSLFCSLWKLTLQHAYWLTMEPEKSLNHAKEDQRLFSFGLIADVQYADIDNRLNFTKTNMRYYRNALPLLQDAVSSWNKSEEDLSFVVQLGDLLDGFNSEKGKKTSSAVAKQLFSELAKSSAPVHSVLGNHEFYNFTRKELFERGFFSGYELGKKGGYVKGSSAPQGTSKVTGNSFAKSFEEFCKPLGVSSSTYPSYYHFVPFEGFRVLFLDTYDLSVLGYDADSEIYKKSKQILRSVNKNEQWNSPLNLLFKQRHFVAFNGGVGERQLHWLKGQLEDATAKEEKVILFSHCVINPLATDTVCLAWNYQEVWDVLHQFECVVAIFSGHTHSYGYAVDGHGIHHVVLPGIVEIPDRSNGYATVDVYRNRLCVSGVGAMPSLTLEFHPHIEHVIYIRQ